MGNPFGATSLEVQPPVLSSLDWPDELTGRIQTLPHQREGIGDGRILVEVLAFFTSDLKAVTSRIRGAFHDVSAWSLCTEIAMLFIVESLTR